MEYTVLTKGTEEGFSAWVPGLPGCWSEGVKKAIRDYLAVAEEVGSRVA